MLTVHMATLVLVTQVELFQPVSCEIPTASKIPDARLARSVPKQPTTQEVVINDPGLKSKLH